jgi:betaine-aldehyde dehydrogenase
VTASPRVLRNFVNGTYVEPESGETSDLVSPVTAAVVATAPVSSAEDVDRAYAAATAAFEVWGQTTPGERQQAMLRFADAVERRSDELVHLETENTGKPYAVTANLSMYGFEDYTRIKHVMANIDL